MRRTSVGGTGVEVAVARGAGAFSLVELLVVMAILVILAAAGSLALGDRKSTSARGGAEALHSLFGQARTQAVLDRARARVVVQNQLVVGKEDDYLRMAAVVVEDEDGEWRRTSPWMRLPEGVFFHEVQSKKDKNMPVEAGGQEVGCVYFEFQPNGQRAGSARVVVSQGELVGGAFQENREEARHGFMVYPMGQRLFLSLSQMEGSGP